MFNIIPIIDENNLKVSIDDFTILKRFLTQILDRCGPKTAKVIWDLEWLDLMLYPASVLHSYCIS